jgi:Uncharacterised nucleotidyltransferase
VTPGSRTLRRAIPVSAEGGVRLHPALVAAARHGLEAAGPPVAVEVKPEEQAEVLADARFDRLDGLLALSVLDGVVSGSATFVEDVVAQHHEALRSCVALESFAVRTITVLDEAGIDYRLLKGPAVAHLDFDDPSDRCFGDVDLLVPAGRWEYAVDTLARHGFRRGTPELRRGFERRFGKGATLISPQDFELDLHRTFAIGRFGVATRADDLFATAQRFRLGGYEVKALSASNRLLHACYHEAVGGFRGLRAARDVAQMILLSGVDWPATVETAAAWRSSIVVATAVTDAWELLDLDRSHTAFVWAASQNPTSGEAAALRAFRQPLPFRRQALTGLATMPGIGRRAAYLYALGVPSKASRVARQRSLGAHLWRSVAARRRNRPLR